MKRIAFVHDKYHIETFIGTTASCPCVYCLIDEASVPALVEKLNDQKIVFTAITGMDWEKDLSPWPAPRAFRGGKDFGGGADAYLDLLLRKILPRVEEQLAFTPSYRVVAGYSLAGLWALYTAYRTDRFQRVACVSGSLWYDDFMNFMQRHPAGCAADKVYFSLGDKEKMTRNQRMAVVEEYMEKAADLLAQQGTDTVFEKNPGGHFQQPVVRLAKGIRWVLQG